jgi:hypothetical protein
MTGQMATGLEPWTTKAAELTPIIIIIIIFCFLIGVVLLPHQRGNCGGGIGGGGAIFVVVSISIVMVTISSISTTTTATTALIPHTGNLTNNPRDIMCPSATCSGFLFVSLQAFPPTFVKKIGKVARRQRK